MTWTTLLLRIYAKAHKERNSMKKVGFLGECMIELSGQAFGKMNQSYGGDTLNSAIYLNRLQPNLNPYYLTSVGSDSLSEKLVRLWEEEGINTSSVLVDAQHSTGLYQISVDQCGERTFSYWRQNSAASNLMKHPDFRTVAETIDQLDILYLSGISIAILPEEDKVALVSTLQEAKQKGVTLVFDSNYRSRLWETPEQAQHWYKQVLPLCSYALITFDDEMLLWGDEELDDAVSRITALGVDKFVLKLGSEGCVFYEHGNKTLIPTKPIDNVVDTTSAGDSFNAGFLCGIANGLPYTECCQIGNQLAGVVIQYPGAIIPKSQTDKLKRD